MKHLYILIASGLLACPAASMAAPADAWVHLPPAEAISGHDLELHATSVGGWNEGLLVARYRSPGTDTFNEASFERSSSGGYVATVPAAVVTRPGVEYLVAAVTPTGEEEVIFASERAPHLVRVELSENERLAEIERKRVDGRRSLLILSARYRDHGDRGDDSDTIRRAEAAMHYRLFSQLHSFQIGFGVLEADSLDPKSEELRARYGFGGFRLRFHPQVHLDVRAILGFDQNGFMPGTGAGLILGRPHGAHLAFGGEVMGDNGNTGWTRLQWDTVPAVIMAATLATTSLVDGAPDRGNSLALDVLMPLGGSFSVGAELSYASRGRRPGGFGAGLAVMYEL